jgi:hypothetical protein
MNGGDKLQRLIVTNEVWQCLRRRAKCPSEQDLAAFAYRRVPFGRMWHVYVHCRLCRAEYFALRENGTVYELSPTWHKAQIFLAGLLISIAMLAVFFIYRAQDSGTRSVAEQSRREILSQFQIKEPSNGGDVDVRQIVRGTTPFHAMRHYIIVTTPQGQDFVSSEARVSGDSWEGVATFGSAGAGGGEKFQVRVIATKANLSEGTYSAQPDELSSHSISVIRRP